MSEYTTPEDTTSALGNIHQRIAMAMKLVHYIQKEKRQGMQYTIVSHDSVTSKVRPELLKCGIHYYPSEMTFVQNGNRTEVLLKVRFVNIDRPSDFFEVPSFGFGCDSQDKGPGKAISYAVKYALLKAMGLETGDDSDLDHHIDYDPKDPAKTIPLPPTPKTGPTPKPDPTPRPDRILSCEQVMQGINLIECETPTKSVEALCEYWKNSQPSIKAMAEGEQTAAKRLIRTRIDYFEGIIQQAAE